jgi:MFS family permease
LGRLRRYLISFSGFDRDARLFLLTTLVAGAAISLFWINFNLYLAALGLPASTIGLIATGGPLASAITAIPASLLSDRIGRRATLVGGTLLMAGAFAGLIFARGEFVLFLLAAMYGTGQQAFMVVQVPFLTERSRPDQRNEVFALQSAVMTGTSIGAALIGGAVAAIITQVAGIGPGSPDAYRALLVVMVVLAVLATLTLFLLRDDRRGRRPVRVLAGARDEDTRTVAPAAPAAATAQASRSEASTADPDTAALATPARPAVTTIFARFAARVGIRVHDPGLFVRLLLPGFLIALGAGQVIPFLNLFVQRKFGLDLASINAVFAVTSFGTVLAILMQPALARRFGKIGSIVIVQGFSIPFIIVLGFSPILWTVVVAMAVRNSLMNAGNPILNAFAMERVQPGERALLAGTMSLLWSLGWVIAGPFYSVLQATLGFDLGYTVNFIVIIVLYSTATSLYWLWFRHAEADDAAAAGGVTAARPSPTPARGPGPAPRPDARPGSASTR